MQDKLISAPFELLLIITDSVTANQAARDARRMWQVYRVLPGNMKGGDHLGDHNINQRIILKMDLTEHMGQCGLTSSGHDSGKWCTLINTVIEIL